jgi:DNA (cytosine-5)-methyltransferase 1
MENIGLFSFFTGAGFLDLGFEAAGFKTMMANEIDPDFSRV